jgi:hypothetical protein
MNTETNLPDGLNLAIQYCNIGTTQERRNFAADAIRTEHAQRVTLQHHACDLAQRIAELEAERDTTAAHVASIARQLGGEALQVDDIAVRVLAVVAERDALRARLAQIEGQEEPVAQVEVSVPHLRSIVVRDIPGGEIPDAGTQLYARPVPAIPAGWKLVPEEPTPEMEKAGERWGSFPLTTWMDMMDAAPEAAR